MQPAGYYWAARPETEGLETGAGGAGLIGAGVAASGFGSAHLCVSRWGGPGPMRHAPAGWDGQAGGSIVASHGGATALSSGRAGLRF